MNDCKCIYNAIKRTGFIDVVNKGAYIATFAVGYTFNETFFAFDSPRLIYNKSYRIAIPTDATGVLFLARFYLTSSETRVICRQQYPTSVRKYFELKGTIFNSWCSEIGWNNINYKHKWDILKQQDTFFIHHRKIYCL